MSKYTEIKTQFEKHADKENQIGMQNYMRNRFKFYGIKTPLRREIYREFLKVERKNQQIDWQFLDKCYADEHREFQYLVCDYLIRMQKFITFEDLPHIQYFIQTKSWWDTVDALNKVIGKLTQKDQRAQELMLKWSTADDFWLRRIAIDHQLSFKEKTNPDLLAQVIVNNFGSDEFFINKAIGWSLRDYSKVNPTWVKQFVDEYRTQMNPLSIREASKYLD